METWRELAERVRAWGRWGPEDEVGALNKITPSKVVHAAGLVRKGATFSLAIPFEATGPQPGGGGRTNPRRHMVAVSALPLHTTDPVRDDESRSPIRVNDDVVYMPLQAATQWDALSHVQYDGALYNGFPAGAVDYSGASRCGVETAAFRPGVVGRAVLLDVAATLGRHYLSPDFTVEPDLLDETARRSGVAIGGGDIVCIRTGWRRRFLEAGRDGWAQHSPGISWRCAAWFHEHDIAAVASDNVAVERLRSDDPEAPLLALHMLAIRDMGMMLGELWDLEELAADCAADGVYEFLLVAAALPFVRGVGSPVNPIALK